MERQVAFDSMEKESDWMEFTNNNLDVLFIKDSVFDINGLISKGYNLNDTFSIQLKCYSGLNFLLADSGFGKTSLLNSVSFKLYQSNFNYYYLTQNSKIFNGTIRENVAIGRSVSDQEILEALKIVSLEDVMINRFNNDFLDSFVYPGRDLSGGQEQRLCLARALIGHPSIILLDEPFSSVDSKTALEIQSKLKNYAINHSMVFLIISHGVFDAQLCNVIEL